MRRAGWGGLAGGVQPGASPPLSAPPHSVAADSDTSSVSPVSPRRRSSDPTAQNTTPNATITANAPSVTDSKNARDTPQLLSIEYGCPNHELIAPGHSSVTAVTTTNNS